MRKLARDELNDGSKFEGAVDGSERLGEGVINILTGAGGLRL